MAGKNWIKGAVKRPGALTAKANKAGEGVQTFAHQHAHDSGRTGQQARLALTFNKLRKAAQGAVVEVESPEAHQQEVAQGKEPVAMNPNEPNMILVGDGGKDPAAEEYVYVPPGQQVVVAPKGSPMEKPSLSNGIKAVANMKLKKAATGITPTIGKDVFPQYDSRGEVIAYGSSPMEYTPPAPTPSQSYTQATTDYNQKINDYNNALNSTPTSPTTVTTVSRPATPYDPGVSRGSVPSADSLITSLVGTQPNPVVSNQEERAGARPGMQYYGAENGAVSMIADLLRAKLTHAASGATTQKPILSPGGMVIGYESVPVAGLTPEGSAADQLTAYQQGQLALGNKQIASNDRNAQLQADTSRYGYDTSAGASRYGADVGYKSNVYQTDAQRAIAANQLAYQREALAATNAINQQRLALDTLLGKGQLENEQKRVLNEALQQLATRAGRQLVAPGGDVIPSMQPVLGRSIN